MQFSSEDVFEVIKPQMMFNEGLLVYLQNVNLEKKMSCCTLQNCRLIAGPIAGYHGAQPSCGCHPTQTTKLAGCLGGCFRFLLWVIL